jgi:mono/diheme cytochrome c family protein/uncharacterized membrane protein
MNWKQFAIVCALGVASCGSGMARAGDLPSGAGRDLPSEARAVFATKCALCHGPDVPNPRAGFGHVLDLKRLAAEPDKVVPSKPDESGLWQQVHNEEMPPPNSPAGALTAQEKEVIRAWIEAGAPADSFAPSSQANEAPAAPVVWRALLWVGKFHLLLVHFPIALLFAAVAGELGALWTPRQGPSPAVRFCLNLGAVSAVAAASVGWLFALGRHDSSGLLALHRWFGTMAAAWAVAVAVWSEVGARRGTRSWAARALLLVGALLVGVTAHLGGLMIHGKGFYDW